MILPLRDDKILNYTTLIIVIDKRREQSDYPLESTTHNSSATQNIQEDKSKIEAHPRSVAQMSVPSSVFSLGISSPADKVRIARLSCSGGYIHG